MSTNNEQNRPRDGSERRADTYTEYPNLVFLDLEQTGDSTIRPAENPATLNPPRPKPPGSTPTPPAQPDGG